MGIDLQPTRDLVQALKIPVVAAGGVTTIEDVLALREAGAAGAVAGTAIYTGKLSVRQTLEALEVKIMRKGEAEGLFRECRAKAALDLDGSGKAAVSSGSGFLDHMLTALARTALLDLTAKAEPGFYRTEALGSAIGLALDSSLGGSQRNSPLWLSLRSHGRGPGRCGPRLQRPALSGHVRRVSGREDR